MIAKHSYSGETFDFFLSNFTPKEKEDIKETNLIKVASSCVDCPVSGNVSASTCNTCKHASGVSYIDEVTHIKCAYEENKGLKKEASSVQGYHWDNVALPSQEKFDSVQNEIRDKIAEELKFAAGKINVKLAQDNLDDFAKMARKERLSGRKLERAAQKYVSKLTEKIALPERRTNSGKLDEIFSAVMKNTKTIVSTMSSPTVGDNETASGSYLGSKTNPNTIWNPDEIRKAAQVPGNDEIIRESKKIVEEEKKEAKKSYWKNLQEKLSQINVIPNAKVHSTSTKQKNSFNSNLPQNGMGIFGDHKEFDNVPEKTAGETIKDNIEKVTAERKKEKQTFSTETAKKMESENWLFK